MSMGCTKPSRDEESHTDSGVASSMEETSNVQRQRVTLKNTKTGKGKVTSQTKKKMASSTSASGGQGQFVTQANSDLIFDLDF